MTDPTPIIPAAVPAVLAGELRGRLAAAAALPAVAPDAGLARLLGSDTQAVADLINSLAPDLPELWWRVTEHEIRGQVDPGTPDGAAEQALLAWAERLELSLDVAASQGGMHEYVNVPVSGRRIAVWGVTDDVRWEAVTAARAARRATATSAEAARTAGEDR